MENFVQLLGGSDIAFTMIGVEGGVFDMGSEDSEREKPVHPVRVSDYWMGEVQVTQGLWYEVVGQDDSKVAFKGRNRPIETVSWLNIVNDFLSELNLKTEGIRPEGSVYRLPTEVEWSMRRGVGNIGKKGHVGIRVGIS